MHTDAVVSLTGLSFNAVWMSLVETISCLSLWYLLIDAFNGHRILSSTHVFSCLWLRMIVPHELDSVAMSDDISLLL